MPAELNPPLHGALVCLEPLTAAHTEPLRALAVGDPAVFEWIGDVPNSFDAWMTQALADDGPFATVDRATGEVVGSTRFMTWRPEHRGVEIGGTWLHSSRWRTGINTEAKLLMLDHAFERLGCQRVELKTHASNARSRAAMEGIGATFEGIHRKHMLIPGLGVRDSAFFSIVDDEWPAVRDRLRGRLAARAADTVNSP
jgi:RimJ/RimL family protein N-acetyltransferase